MRSAKRPKKDWCDCQDWRTHWNCIKKLNLANFCAYCGKTLKKLRSENEN